MHSCVWNIYYIESYLSNYGTLEIVGNLEKFVAWKGDFVEDATQYPTQCLVLSGDLSEDGGAGWGGL